MKKRKYLKLQSTISYQYSESATFAAVSVFRNGKPVTRVIVDKETDNTTIEVFKEGTPHPVERYVYNKTLDENRQKYCFALRTGST